MLPTKLLKRFTNNNQIQPNPKNNPQATCDFFLISWFYTLHGWVAALLKSFTLICFYVELEFTSQKIINSASMIVWFASDCL